MTAFYLDLTEGKRALVSEEDREFLMQWKWRCGGGGYAFRTVCGNTKSGKVSIYMHRIVIERATGSPIPRGAQVDHIDGNKLNNVRGNLRFATHSQNQMNSRPAFDSSSRYKGVSWIRRDQRWHVEITANRKTVYIGSGYPTEEEAARAYDAKAREMFGEFARLNFPDEQKEETP